MRQLLPGCTGGFDWPWQLPMPSLVLVLAKCVCALSVRSPALPYHTNASELMFIPLIKLRLWLPQPSLKGELSGKLHCVFAFGASFRLYWVVMCSVSFNLRECIGITYVDAILVFSLAGIIWYICPATAPSRNVCFISKLLDICLKRNPCSHCGYWNRERSVGKQPITSCQERHTHSRSLKHTGSVRTPDRRSPVNMHTYSYSWGAVRRQIQNCNSKKSAAPIFPPSVVWFWAPPTAEAIT